MNVEKVQPIYVEGTQKGILMLHGLTASPDDFRDYAERFVSKKYTVSVPLLAGHGTNIQNLEKTKWQEWYADVKTAYMSLTEKCDQIIVIGQSIGGALALHLAARYKIDGLVLLAPGLFFKNKATMALPLLSLVKKYINKRNGPDIKNEVSKKRAISYTKMPLRSISETAHLFEQIKNELHIVFTPVLIFHSIYDHVIDYKSSEYIFNHISSKCKRLITLRNSYHILSLDNEKNIILKEIISFIKTTLNQ